jgi:hypothetical protein
MTIEQEAADLLERAADGFESGRYGWTRGQYSRRVFGNQAYCSLGALSYEANVMAGQDTPVWNQAVEALAAHIAPDATHTDPLLLITNPGYLVVKWNDEDTVLTKHQVAEAMKHAAKELRNKEGNTV